MIMFGDLKTAIKFLNMTRVLCDLASNYKCKILVLKNLAEIAKMRSFYDKSLLFLRRAL